MNHGKRCEEAHELISGWLELELENARRLHPDGVFVQALEEAQRDWGTGYPVTIPSDALCGLARFLIGCGEEKAKPGSVTGEPA